jgi:hypothetical protein
MHTHICFYEARVSVCVCKHGGDDGDDDDDNNNNKKIILNKLK